MRACEGETETACWLICDHATIRKYGLGFAKPSPVPLGKYISNGYLQWGKTLDDLARATKIDAEGLKATITAYNGPAAKGEDPEFGRGRTAFNRYLADPEGDGTRAFTGPEKAAERPLFGEVARWYVGEILRGVRPPESLLPDLHRRQARPLAFKTGTSYGFRDAWAIGYDSEHTIGVWVGRSDGTPNPGPSD